MAFSHDLQIIFYQLWQLTPGACQLNGPRNCQGSPPEILEFLRIAYLVHYSDWFLWAMQGWARDLPGRDRDRDLGFRDRDVCPDVRDETETETFPARDETETRPWACLETVSRPSRPINYWQSACSLMRWSLIMQPIIAVALMLQQNSNTRPLTRLILTTITCQNLGPEIRRPRPSVSRPRCWQICPRRDLRLRCRDRDHIPGRSCRLTTSGSGAAAAAAIII